MTRGFRKEIAMKLFYQYITIFFNLQPILSHFHPLQVENCDSNSRLVVGEGDNGKFRPERVKHSWCIKASFCIFKPWPNFLVVWNEHFHEVPLIITFFFSFATHFRSSSSTTAAVICGLYWMKMTMVHSGLEGLNPPNWIDSTKNKNHFESQWINCFNNNDIIFSFVTHLKSSSSTTCRELREQFAACSGWDDNCKFKHESVNTSRAALLKTTCPCNKRSPICKSV